MSSNQSYIRFDGTQVTLVRIELEDGSDVGDLDSKILKAAKECIRSIKNNTFDYNLAYNLQQGSVTCFGLLVTHLGEHPSPFWFETYKNISITSLQIKGGSDHSSHYLNRNDKFVSRDFPQVRCLTNEDGDPFVLHLKFIGLELNNSSIGTMLHLEVQASPSYVKEESASDDLSSPSHPFVLYGRMIVNQTLKINGFIENNMLFLEMMNTDFKMDVEIEEVEIKNTQVTKDEIELPMIINSGSQLNFSIRLPKDSYEKSRGTDAFLKLMIKWNLNQNLSMRYSTLSTLQFKAEEIENTSQTISITCSVKNVDPWKMALELNIKVKVKMDILVRAIKDYEHTHYNKLIPLNDTVEIGAVDVGEDKHHHLYFYYSAPGLNISPKMEVLDRISGESYSIHKRIFTVDPKCV